MTAATEIVAVPRENALQVYTADNGLDPYLAKIREEIDGFIPDVSTDKGRRQADEQARVESEAKAREADRAHKTKVNRQAVAAFVSGGMTEEAAKQAVTLIAKRQIPNITISY